MTSSIHNGWRAEPENSRLAMFYDGTRIAHISDCGITLVTGSGIVSAGGALTVNDDILLGIGTGQTARLSYDTTDVNANAVIWQLPAGGGTDVPVIAIGQSIESVDLGLFNGVVDPRLALFSSGAVTTGGVLESYKARGTTGTPTVVTAADDLFTIRALGYSGAGGYVASSEIVFDTEATVATTRMPGVINLRTATDAAPSVMTTAISIGSDQIVEVTGGGLHVGVTGTATGAVTFDGATSGTVILSAQAVAGCNVTFQLPAADGACGTQLTTSGAGVMSWAAASQREYKDLGAPVCGSEALSKVLATTVYNYTYNEAAKEAGYWTGNGSPMTGIVADEAPWAMQGPQKQAFSSINAFGTLLAAFQVLSRKVDGLALASA